MQGLAHEVTEAIDSISSSVRGFLVDAWAPGDKGSWIRIEARNISGRRIRRD